MAIEWKKENKEKPGFSLNDIQVRALLAGLCSAYHEVFIWSTQTHVAIWVVGNESNLLFRTFRHFQDEMKHTRLFHGTEASQFFNNIMKGEEWKHAGLVEKLYQLEKARALTIETGSLGNALGTLVDQWLKNILQTPQISGLRNGWDREACLIPSRFEFPKLFYRYSLN
jgi:hypothetical protein